MIAQTVGPVQEGEVRYQKGGDQLEAWIDGVGESER